MTACVVGLMRLAVMPMPGEAPTRALPGNPPQTTSGRNIVGRADVTDGDTIRIDGTRIRLTGIDAVEHDQTCTDKQSGATLSCGTLATSVMERLTAGRVITCHETGTDRYGRVLAHCEASDAETQVDLGRSMVRQGWAIAAYGHQYDRDEAAARSDGLGLWAMNFETPADFRHRN